MSYSPEAAAEIGRNLNLVCQELQNLWELLIGEVEPLLKTERAREHVTQGASRRLNIIRLCIRNIFTICPVERTQLLNDDERGDLAINLHAFLINIHGVPDNLAWAYLIEGEIELKPQRVGLFNKDFTQPHFPQEVRDYLNSDKISRWHTQYAKNYCDALAHRIPPYIAPYVVSKVQVEEYRLLSEQISDATETGDYGRALSLMEEQDTCGSICLDFPNRFWTRRHAIPLPCTLKSSPMSGPL